MRNRESRLDVRLFNRTTRSVALTEAGEQLLRRVRPALADLDDAVVKVTAARNRPSGTIRISASEASAKQLVRHVLPRDMIAIRFGRDMRLGAVASPEYRDGVQNQRPKTN